MYTVVSASVLALDLARHPSGAAVADVVDAALALDGPVARSASSAVLALDVDLERAPARQRLLAVADRAPRLDEVLRTVSLSWGTASVAAASRRLHSTLMGRLQDLVVLVQRALAGNGLPPPVVDVVVDSVVATWAGHADDVHARDVAVLRAPWTAVLGAVPPAPPTAGDVPALLALLEAVARAERAQWLALDRAHDAQHRGAAWSELLHSTSGAAVAHQRTVDVARWQLSCVRAVQAAGHAGACAPAAGLSVVGAVQALSLADVLPADVVDRLLAPCRLVLGLPD